MPAPSVALAEPISAAALAQRGPPEGLAACGERSRQGGSRGRPRSWLVWLPRGSEDVCRPERGLPGGERRLTAGAGGSERWNLTSCYVLERSGRAR